MRDRMAGPETGLFFPIMPNHMPWRTSMEGGGLLGGSPLRLFSVGNRRCILVRTPLVCRALALLNLNDLFTQQSEVPHNERTYRQRLYTSHARSGTQRGIALWWLGRDTPSK